MPSASQSPSPKPGAVFVPGRLLRNGVVMASPCRNLKQVQRGANQVQMSDGSHRTGTERPQNQTGARLQTGAVTKQVQKPPVPLCRNQTWLSSVRAVVSPEPPRHAPSPRLSQRTMLHHEEAHKSKNVWYRHPRIKATPS